MLSLLSIYQVSVEVKESKKDTKHLIEYYIRYAVSVLSALLVVTPSARSIELSDRSHYHFFFSRLFILLFSFSGLSLCTLPSLVSGVPLDIPFTCHALCSLCVSTSTLTHIYIRTHLYVLTHIYIRTHLYVLAFVFVIHLHLHSYFYMCRHLCPHSCA